MINTFSPRLLNWVGSYDYAGTTKTVFYSEVNSEIKKGDKVFIINGYYDNNLLIKENKYNKGVDGYNVILVDKCKIVLDINYNGNTKSYIDDENEAFINITQIENEEELNWAEEKGDFIPNNNNIIYADIDIIGPGFYIYDSSWLDISNDIISGSYSMIATQSATRLKVLKGDFEFDQYHFKKDFVYEWGIGEENDGISGTQSEWVVDVRYHRPIISKTNFRDVTLKENSIMVFLEDKIKY